MPLNKEEYFGNIIEIINKLNESLDKNLKEAEPFLIENKIISYIRINYIKYLINIIRTYINEDAIEYKSLKNINNFLLESYYNSLDTILNNCKNHLYIYTSIFNDIISDTNFFLISKLIIIEYCYSIYTTLNNLYFYINNFTSLLIKKPYDKETYEFYLSNLNKQNQLKIYIFSVDTNYNIINI
jgi:hypothetical protein